MAELSTSTVANILATTYNREDYLAPHERFSAKFWSETEKFEDPGGGHGASRKWEIVTGDSHSVAATTEGGDWPTFAAPASLQASITAIQIVATLRFSELLLDFGKADGLVSKVDVVKRYVNMTTRNMMSALNRHSLGHGTGRLAVVQTTTSSSTTFVCRNPESVYQLRKGMSIDFYDTDTGGSKQGASETITHIDRLTRTVTISSRSLTAGWSVYRTGEYGLAMTGLRAVSDAGTLTSAIFGITRSSNPEVNAMVFTASGGTQPYSEKLMRKAVNSIGMEVDLEPDEAWTNQGIISEHLNHLTGTRVYQQVGDGVPSYQIGQNEAKLGFQNNGKFIPYRVDRDLPNREIHFIVKNLFRKHLVRDVAWEGDNVGPDGSSTPMFLQAPSTTTYATAKIGALRVVGNLGHLGPKGVAKVAEINDEELAGD